MQLKLVIYNIHIHVDPKSNFLQHYIKETAIEENTKD